MLPTTPADLERFLREKEGPTLECKAAKATYDSRKLRKYLCALANEGGGHFVLGVSDQPPRRVLGSGAFPNAYADLNQIQQDLRPPPALSAREINHPDGRVLLFEVGARHRGQVVRYENVPWARSGESLVPMDDRILREVLLEDVDASAEVCREASLDDLDPDALAAFRSGVVAKARDEHQKARYAAMDAEPLLKAARLMRRDGALTRAALLLLGREDALGEWVDNAEVVFEYRRIPTATRYDRRVVMRRSLLLSVEELSEEINRYAYDNPIEVTEGTRVTQRPRYPKRAVREALLNAVTHRDYHDAESVVVRMSPDTLVVTSPGPFPATITPENVADEEYRRNRVLAEALEKCGQIERSGQGIDLMIAEAVRMAQPLPTFEEPNGRKVRVTLHGLSDSAARSTLHQIPDEAWVSMSTAEIVALDSVRRGVARREIDPEAARRLIERGYIEPGGTGDTPFMFSPLLTPIESGEALQESFSQLLTSSIRTLARHPEGMTLSEIRGALGSPDVEEVKRVLQWLKRSGLVYTTGRTRGARWHPNLEEAKRRLESSF